MDEAEGGGGDGGGGDGGGGAIKPIKTAGSRRLFHGKMAKKSPSVMKEMRCVLITTQVLFCFLITSVVACLLFRVFFDKAREYLHVWGQDTVLLHNLGALKQNRPWNREMLLEDGEVVGLV